VDTLAVSRRSDFRAPDDERVVPMTFLRRLLGLDALKRRVEETKTALDKLAERVEELERRVQPSTPHNCRDWEAWHDRMPGAQATLHVTGRCEFPTSGYSVRLERHEPQGINPRDLLLDLVITEPTGPVTQVVTEEEVRYDEQTDLDYDSVTILPDGPTVNVTTTR
jgi:hypothetical protein